MRGRATGGACGAGAAAAAAAQAAGSTADWGQGTGRAHPKHEAHIRDAGGVEAQRLVERQCVLPRVERRACTLRREVCESAGAGRRATAVQAACGRGPGDGRGVGPAAAAQAACAGRNLNCGGYASTGTRGAYIKQLLHTCDAGCVPAQWLVKRLRFLPRRKASVWEEGGVWEEGWHAGPGDGRGV